MLHEIGTRSDNREWHLLILKDIPVSCVKFGGPELTLLRSPPKPNIGSCPNEMPTQCMAIECPKSTQPSKLLNNKHEADVVNRNKGPESSKFNIESSKFCISDSAKDALFRLLAWSRGLAGVFGILGLPNPLCRSDVEKPEVRVGVLVAKFLACAPHP